MPPRKKILKGDIVSAAFHMLQKHGQDALNARSLASYIGCSTQPIFSNFASMEELKNELILASYQIYRSYLEQELTLQRYPEYKASGMAYICFAHEKKEVFKFLFMRDRSCETVDYLEDTFTDSVYCIHKQLEITYEEATMFHMEILATPVSMEF